MGAQFVTDFDRWAIGNDPHDQAFLGEKPKFVRKCPTGDAGEHLLHFVDIQIAAHKRSVKCGKEIK